jgi:hypothetical protein
MPLENFLGAFALHIEAVHSNVLSTTVPSPRPVGKATTTGVLFPMLEASLIENATMSNRILSAKLRGSCPRWSGLETTNVKECSI